MSEASPFGVVAAGALQSAGQGVDRVRSAIARAAQATGVDFNYLMAQAKLESGLDPQAKAGTSSAAGLYQFTSGTWLGVLGRHGDEHGLGAAAAATGNPAMRQQLLQLRYDPEASASMAAELAVENKACLSATLGREPDNAELYLAHFMGQAGATRFLSALNANPGQSAPSLFPREAASNRAIFFDGGAPRTLGGVMALLRDKVSRAMDGADGYGVGVPGGIPGGIDAIGSGYATAAFLPRMNYEPLREPVTGPMAAEFQAARAEASGPVRSMSDTLRGAFGDGAGESGNAGGKVLPSRVAAAYEKLARFGL
ncbi:lytic transglycosylase domain-containing protein [Novosphingobium sp. 9]|uniref:lytic transglycosylase domain-containing protein n=1 Tax=Novosphingobium sp. 9 TaxID=2025349 RepID=UPI0021B67B48|nr:lytic transglycosylase domain-containing protein [Novosphingobium sp. 9]